MDNSVENEILRSLGRIEGQQTAMHETLKATATRVDSLETRIGSLEKWQSWIKGGLAALALMFGAVLKAFGHGK